MNTQEKNSCQGFTRMFWDCVTDDLFAFATELRRQARLQKPMLPATCESLARRTVEIAIDPQTMTRPNHQTACLAVTEALAVWIGRCRKPELVDTLEDLIRACWVFHAPKSNQVQVQPPTPKKAKQNDTPKQPPIGDAQQARRKMWGVLGDLGLSESVMRHIALDLFGDRSTRNLTANQIERITAQIRAYGPDIQAELKQSKAAA